jgi:hypothetical protein
MDVSEDAAAHNTTAPAETTSNAVRASTFAVIVRFARRRHFITNGRAIRLPRVEYS